MALRVSCSAQSRAGRAAPALGRSRGGPGSAAAVVGQRPSTVRSTNDATCWNAEFGLPSLERRLDLVTRIATASNPLCGTVLRVLVVQDVAVCVDFQHIAVDREDLFQRRSELEESGSIVKTFEQIDVNGAIRQVEGEEPK
nr:hypothetical protein [Streptomyces lushanensis]